MARLLLAGGLGGLPAVAHAEQLLYDFDFGISDHAFDTSEDDVGLWAWGTPQKESAGSYEGNVWATGLDDAYLQKMRSSLLSPVLNLAAYPGATVVLEHFYDTDTDGLCEPDLRSPDLMSGVDSCGDGGIVRLRTGDEQVNQLFPDSGYNGWVFYDDAATGAFSGNSADYVTSYFDLLGLTAGELRMEFLFVSNASEVGAGWFLRALRVYDGDVIPPRVSIPVMPEDTSDVQGPYYVQAEAADNRELGSVELYFAVADEESFVAQTMSELAVGTYLGSIPGQGTGTDIRYYVEARDLSGNEATFPAAAPEELLSFRVRLPAPYNLDFTDGEAPLEATSVGLTWEEPRWGTETNRYAVGDYQVLHSAFDSAGVLALEEYVTDLDGVSTDTSASVEASGFPYTDRYAVRARFVVPDGGGGYNLVPGDLSEPRDAVLVVPRIESIEPAVAYQGYDEEIDIHGTYTKFVAGDVRLDFGPGVNVLSVGVQDISNCTAAIEVEGDAPIGFHTLVVSWPGIRLEFEPGLEVLSEDQRPRIERVEPEYIRQREKKVIKFFGANTDFINDTPLVEFGSGLSAGALEVLSTTEFQVEVEAKALTPTGERSLTVVSGDHSFEVPFRVEIGEIPSACVCSAQPGDRVAGGEISLLTIVAGGLFILRRRRDAGEPWLRGDYAVHRMASESGDGSLPAGTVPGSLGQGQLARRPRPASGQRREGPRDRQDGGGRQDSAR